MSNREWLLIEYCQLVNKNFYFIQKYFEGIVPAGRPDESVYWKTKEMSERLRALVETKNMVSGLEQKNGYKLIAGGKEKEEQVNGLLEEYLAYAAEYFEKGDPWNTREQNRRACCNTILTCLQMIANLTVWLEILGEEPAHCVCSWLELDADWEVHSIHSGTELTEAKELTFPAVSFGA